MAKKRNARIGPARAKDLLNKDLLNKDLLIKARGPKRLPAKDLADKDRLSKDLWIADRYSLKGPAGERAWENRRGGAPNSSRFLELADIALGLKKRDAPRKKNSLTSMHDTSKTEPYSNK